MRILYFDLVGGIAGDMTVAALVDLGVPLQLLRDGLRAVGLEQVEIATEPARRHHITGTRFTVHDLAGHSRSSAPVHPQSHTQPHTHGAGPESREAPGHPHRSYREIRTLLEGSALSQGAKTLALAVFARLAEAEGAVHGIPAQEVTFHEVGAWDAIADVVCTAVGLDYLRPDVLYCSPVPLGAGSVRTAHGVMPVPAPATLKLLEGFPVTQGGPAFERTTPTGAAILAALVRPVPDPLTYVPAKVGIGIGTQDDPEVPNLLRLVLGDSEEQTAGQAARGVDVVWERIECAEANLDDANPEWSGYLMERLLTAGVLDVGLLPVHMKKNRPGTLVQVLYPPALRATVLEVLFTESTTLGVRFHALERAALQREPVTVDTPYGPITGKVAHVGGELRFTPEYEACRAAALAHGVPLQEVYRAAERARPEATRTPARKP